MAVVIVQNQVDETEREDIERILVELETFSDEQIRRLLADKD